MLNKPYISNQLKQNQTTSNNYKLPPTTSKNTMAYTESNMIPIGTLAPAFELLDPSSGKLVSLQEIAAGAKATVVMFLCNHCPYVLYINPEIVRIVAEYKAKGVAFVGQKTGQTCSANSSPASTR